MKEILNMFNEDNIIINQKIENLSGYTSTELLKLINNIKSIHDNLKQEIINYTIEIDELENKININLEFLLEYEKKYVKLIEELNNR